MAAPSTEHKSVAATCAALDHTVNQVAATSSEHRSVAATCAALDQAVYQALGIPLPMDHEEDNQPQRRNLGRHTLLESAEPQRSSTAH